MNLETLIADTVRVAVDDAIRPVLARLDRPERKTYTLDEAAIAIGVSERTVRRLVREGHLAAIPNLGQRVVLTRASVDEFCETPARPLQRRKAS